MSKFHDFLLEHAKFPWPHPDERRSTGTSDISTIEVGLLKREWKANHAVRDDALVQKLCHTLKDILGETLLEAAAESYILEKFSQVDAHGKRDSVWDRNPSEAHSRLLLNQFFDAASRCLWKYGGYNLSYDVESSVEGGSSRVDYVLLVDGEPKSLCEAKSPSVMKKVGELLPARGIELEWNHSQSLVRKILGKSALYLGLREIEWLFLSCHNSWIVCRLVKDDNHPFLAYSSITSIEDSSEPFRALLGATLSVTKCVPVQPSPFNPDMELDAIIEEDEDPGPSPEDNIDDSSGGCPGSSSKGTTTDPPLTRRRKRNCDEDTESELMLTSSSPNSPASFQVWLRLHTFPNNILALPQCSGRRLWLTRFVGFGSTGNVWQCRFDKSDNLFAAKIVEVLRRSDAESRQRLRNEFNVYLTLEGAYRSGQLDDRIAPRCYGAFEGDGVDILILELCNDTLRAWDELSDSERAQVYRLVQRLHSVGIVHGDLEPRNVVRVHGGGFRLIDFSESRKHICRESKVGKPHPPDPASVQKHQCSELQTLRHMLRRPLPLQTDAVNVG